MARHQSLVKSLFDARVLRANPTAFAARAVILSLLSRMTEGAVIIDEAGRRQLLGRPIGGERVPELHVIDPQAWVLAARDGSAGVGHAYFEGMIAFPSSDQLVEFVRVISRNVDGFESARSKTSRAMGPLRHVATRPNLRRGTRVIDRANIRAHYDLGNEFFKSFLDDGLTYSCAIFDDADDDLREAQVRKLDRLCKKLSIGPADHVLEIGTGWGSFAIHAASHYGCQVTTTTISQRQYELASERVKAAGLEHLVTVLSEDYRDLKGTYDKLVSIEMIEALDWRQYPTYFETCAKLLKPEGLMGLQAIVIADRYYERAKHTEDFIKRYIFPGSCIPAIGVITEHAAQADLSMIGLDDIGQHYVETLARWRHRLEAVDLQALGEDIDEATRAMFVFYLAYCEAGFAERRISDVQCIFAGTKWRPAGLVAP